MRIAEPHGLYHVARNQHVARRDKALSYSRRAITRPGNCEASITYEKIREWFYAWEKQLWDTYKREERSLAISWADVQGDPCRPSRGGYVS